MKLLKKMSHSSLNSSTPAAVKALVDASTAPIFICRIIGLCRGQEVIKTTFGDSLKFKGEFRGWGADGEESMAPVAYLPSPFDELLSQQINDLQGDDGKKAVTVEFGLDVFAIADKGTVGYKFIVKPLIEAAASDPLAALTKSFAPMSLPNPEAAKVLSAPTEEVVSEDSGDLKEFVDEVAAANKSKAKAGK